MSRGFAAQLGLRIQAYTRLVSCWRVLIDARELSAPAGLAAGSWPQQLVTRLPLPVGVRVALLYEAGTLPVARVARAAQPARSSRAAFASSRAALDWLRAGDADVLVDRSTPIPLATVKELLRQFTQERHDANRAVVERELRDLYRHLLEQADRLGLDAQAMVEALRRSAPPAPRPQVPEPEPRPKPKPTRAAAAPAARRSRTTHRR